MPALNDTVDEEARLASVYEYDVLDKPLDGLFIHILQMARNLLGAFDAGLGFVDRDRVCYYSLRWEGAREVSRSNSVGALVATLQRPLIIEDVQNQERLRENPIFQGQPNALFREGTPPLRFIAAIPLRGITEFTIGGIGVLDTKPRKLTDLELGILQSFGNLIMRVLDSRLLAARLKQSQTEKLRLIEEHARQMLTERLASIGQITAGIAHEINSPLQFVRGNTDFLQEAVSSFTAALTRIRDLEVVPSPGGERLGDSAFMQALNSDLDLDYTMAEVPRTLVQTKQGIERVTEMVNALKRFTHSAPRENQMEQLNDAIREAIIITRNSWKSVASLSLDLSNTLPLVKCNLGEINQVLINLLINAGDAMRERWPDARNTPGRIVLRSFPSDEGAVIEVEDTGGGIPKEIITKIFDPFFTTKDVGKGTGQGLAISYDIIVRRHGGALEVESNRKAGTTLFRISLPIHATEMLVD